MSTSLVNISVGTELPSLQIPPISRTTLALFAGASGDHNPIHIDVDAAHSAGMEDVFAHGMLSMAYLGRLLTDWFPQDRILTYRVRFVAITPVLARLTCTGRVTDVSDGVASIDVAATLEDGTATLTGEATVSID